MSRLVQGNTRQGRRQECQVPKLISPEEEKEKKEEIRTKEKENDVRIIMMIIIISRFILIMVIVVCQHRQRRCHHQQHQKQQRSPLPKIKIKRNRAGCADKDETTSTTDHTQKSVPRCCLNTCDKFLRKSGPHCASVGNGHGQQTCCCRRLFRITLYLDSPTTEPKNTTGTTHWDSIRDNSPQIISAPPKRIAPSQKATSKEKPSSVSTTVLVLTAWASACCVICGCCAYCCCGIIPESLEATPSPNEKAKLSRRAPTRPSMFQQCTRTNGPWSNATTRSETGATRFHEGFSAPTDWGTRCEQRVQVLLRVGEGRTHVLSICKKKKLRFHSCDLKARRRQSLQLSRRRSCMDLKINTNLASRSQAVDEFDPIFSSLGCRAVCGATSVHVEYASQGPEPDSATTRAHCFSLLDEN